MKDQSKMLIICLAPLFNWWLLLSIQFFCFAAYFLISKIREGHWCLLGGTGGSARGFVQDCECCIFFREPCWYIGRQKAQCYWHRGGTCIEGQGIDHLLLMDHFSLAYIKWIEVVNVCRPLHQQFCNSWLQQFCMTCFGVGEPGGVIERRKLGWRQPWIGKQKMVIPWWWLRGVIPIFLVLLKKNGSLLWMQAANAQAALAFKLYQEKFSGPRWEALDQRGAQKQRVLWASTGVKDPSYPDTLYVNPLIGPDTVSTYLLFLAFKSSILSRYTLV